MDNSPRLAAAAVPAAPRWLLPDLSAVLTIATLYYCLFVFGAGERLFRDSDSGWHIRNGEWILAHRALPTADPYSFSKEGQAWFAWEWGSDVLMGLAHRWDGLRGVATLFAVAIAVCTWLWCRLQLSLGGDFFLAAVLAPPFVTTTSLHWLARPHVLSWIFLLVALWYAERTSARFSWSALAAIAAFSALWANLHASFFLAPAIALLYAAAHFAGGLSEPRPSEKGGWFLCVAAAACAGSLLNPYGWRLHAHVISYLLDSQLTARVAEFQSFNFHDKDATQVTLTMAIAALGGVLALTQRKLPYFFLAAALLWAALRSARVIPLVALLILPLANNVLADALRATRGLAPKLQRALDGWTRYSSGLRRIDMRLNGAVFLAVAAPLLLIAMRAPAYSKTIGFSATRFPVEAAQAIEKLPANARVASSDLYGGYLIYRFNGQRKVFFDGRSDFYGADFMKQYLVLITAQPGWRDIARGFGFTHALLPNDSALKAALEQAGWANLHQDQLATLLEAP